jgi:hypothetical protein
VYAEKFFREKERNMAIQSLNSIYDSFFGTSSVSQNSRIGSANKQNDMFSSLGSSISDLSMMKAGTYKKLVSSYYKKFGASGASGTRDAVSSELSNLKKTSGNASDVKDALKSLSKFDFSDEKSGEDSLAAAKKFVDSYNSLVGNSVEVNRQSVLKGTVGVVNYMKSNAGMLNELGMKLGTDNKITFDEDKWKSSYATSKKSMFNGVGSFAYQMSYKAGQVATAAASGTGKATPATTYTKNGSYNNNFNSNNLSWLFDTVS